MPKKEREFAVTKRGTGKPDFMKKTAPSRSTLGENQRTWRDLWDGDISGDSMVIIETYTVPKGWRLFMGGGFISCDAEVIQLVKLIATPGMLGDFWYKLRGDIILGEPATMIFEPGTILTYYIYNEDSSTHHFSISLLGIEEKV